MRILAIETSCDDTCVAIVETLRHAQGKQPQRNSKIPRFKILANIVSSQTDIHKKYGGVVPTLAKRAHQENLVPVLLKALGEAGMFGNEKLSVSPSFQPASPKTASRGGRGEQSKVKNIEKILEREPALLEQFIKSVLKIKKPKVDLIAVTHGPGLEPALWAGVNFARALSYWWDIPLLGVDHMEGHIAANFLQGEGVEFPAIVLAVSGGHTQLILVKDILKYKLLGETVDDAAGEGFDKVARMLGLSFPGGPEIAKKAIGGDPKAFDFPRPMLHSKDYNFSFSGLKTAVLYTLKKLSGLDLASFQSNGVRPRSIDAKTKRDIAASFQQAAVDVLIAKTIRAAKEYKVKTIMLAGGVAANEELRKQLGEKIKELEEKEELKATASFRSFMRRRINYKLPARELATDNAAMIAAAAYFHWEKASLTRWKNLKANGSLKISRS